MKKQLQCWICFLLLITTSAGSADQISVYKNREDARKPVYSFRSSNNSNSRSESRHGKVTIGSYRVPLPDGRVQIVNYRADENGYVADIQYEEVSESKTAASYSASAYKAPAYIEITPPPIYEVFTTTARTNVYPTTNRNYYEVPVTTTPVPPTQYEVPNAATPAYEAPYRIPAKSGHAVLAAPIPLAFRTFYPSKSSKKMNFSLDKEYKIENQTPALSPPSDKPLTITAPAVSAYVTKSPVNKVVTTVSSAFAVPTYPTSTYSKPASPEPAYSFRDYKAPTVTASESQSPATTELAKFDLLYSSPAYSAPEYRSPTPIYKASTYFNSNKERVSTGYKELSRIFRETSLTAGNKNWEIFFNKAWEFARTKY